MRVCRRRILEAEGMKSQVEQPGWYLAVLGFNKFPIEMEARLSNLPRIDRLWGCGEERLVAEKSDRRPSV